MDKGSVYGDLTNARRLHAVKTGESTGSVYGNHANARRWGSAQAGNKGSVYGSMINAQRLVSINAHAFVSNESLHSRIGGDEMVTSTLRYFYGKALRDRRIRSFFDYADVKDLEKRIQSQLAFLRVVLGGPHTGSVDKNKTYEYLASLGLGAEHFEAVIDSLVVTLREQNVPHQLIGEMVALCESVRDEVLSK